MSELGATSDTNAEMEDSGTFSMSLSRPMLLQKMKNITERLRSFTISNSWPLSYIQIDDLANSGFFYLQSGDRVMCPYCEGVLGLWEEGDNPFIEHRKHFPNCSFVLSSQGIRSIDSPSNLNELSFDSYDIPPVLPEVVENVNLRDSYLMEALSLMENNESLFDLYGIKEFSKPVYGKYITDESRNNSFPEKWPKILKKFQKQLAEAGFFYKKSSDDIRCYFCDTIFINCDNDPFIEHSINNPECGYLQLNKGKNFVDYYKHFEAKPKIDEDEKLNDKYHQWIESDFVKNFIYENELNVLVSYYAIKLWLMNNKASDLSLDILNEIFLDENESRKKVKLTSEVSEDNEENKMSISPTPTCSIEDCSKCRVCFSNDIGILFLPCSHLVTCTKCALNISKCPMCRAQIKGVVKAYFS